MKKCADPVKVVLVGSPPVGRAHDTLSRELHPASGGGAGPGWEVVRRPINAMLCTGLLISAGLVEVANAEFRPADENPQSAPAFEASGPEGSPSDLRANSTVKWIGLVGLGLIILRGVCRR